MKKCKEKCSGRLLAAKMVSVVKEKEKKDVLNEIEIMQSLQHPRLIQLYDVYQNKEQICLILELFLSFIFLFVFQKFFNKHCE